MNASKLEKAKMCAVKWAHCWIIENHAAKSARLKDNYLAAIQLHCK
jgi:hypothetical protein